MLMSKIGVDTGGTFTDFVWLDGAGNWQRRKVRSTPADPSQAILAGLALVSDSGGGVVHGSTVATNALLERRGARTALITTAGFRDVLAIGRQNRPELYALVPHKPEPFVPAEWRLTVQERTTAVGDILHPLDLTTLEPYLPLLQTADIEAIAICLLFSFLNPQHEQQLRAYLHQQLPHCHLSLSSDILPEYREYERTSTTVINAYVAPLMSRYLARLAAQLAGRPLAIMQSNGGLIQADTAGAQAARTALSGPAGGVVGAYHLAQTAGFTQIITFDMGGTSTDVALCPGRVPLTANGQIASFPLRLPLLDIHTVGAGGGSLAYVDVAGALHVGPESAGANPGPACYPPSPEPRPLPAHIASRATVTDAHVVLGRLPVDYFLGGEMRLDGEAAQAALAQVAGQLGVDTAVSSTAWAILQLANAHMERAIRHISVERGHDPRHFTLLPFGGAGPLHACELASNLGIPRVLIPPLPGVLSALGMLVAHPTKDYAQTILRPLTPAQLGADLADLDGWLAQLFAPLVARAVAEMAQEGEVEEGLTWQYALDMRYLGQSHELSIRLPDGLAVGSLAGLVGLLAQAHEARYGYAPADGVAELVTVRLTAVAEHPLPPLPYQEPEPQPADSALLGTRPVWFQPDQPTPTPLYDRALLRAGMAFAGPALLVQYDTTVLVTAGWHGRVDGWGNLLLTTTT
jgi:N-methylhydantoinase A